MRFLSKLHGCAAAVILVIVYFLYEQRHRGFGASVQQAWQGTAHRVTVFGDDWSDTGNHRVSPISAMSSATRDPDRGVTWAETLCKELACNVIDNFARSVPTNTASSTAGAVVDSEVHAQTGNGKNNVNTLADFKTQVQQYLTYEKEKYRILHRLRNIDQWTVFTVFFGLWDLLEYMDLDKDFAMQAIDNTISELFRQLDLLAKDAPAPMKVVIPRMVDITFLPRFQSIKSTKEKHFAETQHQAVFLWTYWNEVLVRTALRWEEGEIFIPDINSILMDEVAETQLHSAGVSDASGFGGQNPLFENVEQPCLRFRVDGDAQAAVVEKCSNPAAHLFWDDIQLSSTVHQLIGSRAASLLLSNQTAKIEREMQSVYGPGPQEGDGFTLKFPPGY